MNWLTPPEVAKELGVGVHKVWSWIESGELSAANFATAGKSRPRWQCSEDDLAKFIETRRNKPVERRTKAVRALPKVREYIK